MTTVLGLRRFDAQRRPPVDPNASGPFGAFPEPPPVPLRELSRLGRVAVTNRCYSATVFYSAKRGRILERPCAV